MENLADYYYSQLGETTNPGVLLANMYSRIFDVGLERRHYIMFNKLVRLYGRFNTYFAILSVAELENVDHNQYLLPLFTSFIKKRYEKRTDIANIESLNTTNKFINRIEKKKKKLAGEDLVIPESIDE